MYDMLIGSVRAYIFDASFPICEIGFVSQPPFCAESRKKTIEKVRLASFQCINKVPGFVSDSKGPADDASVPNASCKELLEKGERAVIIDFLCNNVCLFFPA